MNLYHYCSNAAFLSIVSGREIWASDFSLSNDPLEGKWIRQVFTEYCSDKGVSAGDATTLLSQLDRLMSQCGGTGFCLSEEADLLSQWRAYADNGAGVSIGFSKEYFEALGATKRDRNDTFNATINQVVYDRQRQKEIIADHADSIFELVEKGAIRFSTMLTSEHEVEERQKHYFRMSLHFMFFVFFIYSLKNPAFSEEREWRLISHVLPSTEGTLDQFAAMDFRTLSDRIVPFRRIPLESLNRSAIAEVVLGPRNITPVSVVEATLRKHSWVDVEVRRSTASYRQ